MNSLFLSPINQLKPRNPKPKKFMSLSPPHIRTNGGRNYRLFWCYQCHRSVRVASGHQYEIICPRCFGEFLHELDVARPRIVVDLTDLNPSQRQLLDALALALDSPDSQRHPGLDGRYQWTSETETVPRPRSWIVFQPTRRARPTRTPSENLAPLDVNPGDYFAGPGLNELIEELTQNDRPGPPPAPASAIDDLPTVRITPTHLSHDSQCPVCKDKFEVGEEAREMPCNHVYHSDCIVPWLRIHNSCPVCRHELKTSGDNDLRNDDVENSCGDVVRNHHRRRWSRLSSLWPFHSSPTNWRY